MNILEEKKKSIRQAMEYAVPPENYQEAEDVLDIYFEDTIGLLLLNEFYSTLPDAQETWVKDILIVARQQGIFLLSAMTGVDTGYLYLVSDDGIEFQGNMRDGFLSQELLDFFQYESEEEFALLCSDPSQLNSYEPLQVDEDICPVCHAFTGEHHELGCPVEICPWCGGQLVHCGCRFEQLGVDAISTEQELIQFEDLLEQRGRISYSPEQRPSFADEGPGVLFE